MKELTIGQKAQRYDEAIERGKSLLSDNKIGNAWIYKLLPELAESEDEKESEDERIRKQLKAFIHSRASFITQSKHDSWIAWIEKQAFNVDNANKEYWRGYREGKQEILDKYAELEKQGEQKPYKPYSQMEKCFNCQFNYAGYCNDTCILKNNEQKPADKVEPKFHKGDWIIHQGTENIYQVVARIDNQYQLKYGDNYTIQKCADVDRCARLWDITKDAKDGDVLYMDNGLSTCTFIYKSIDNVIIQKYASYNKFGFEGTTYLVLNDGYVCPATKEQREQLEKAMTDAGYQWDADKKELRKVKEDLTEFENALANKSTKRSDEDEKYLNIVYSVINQPSAQGIYDYHNVDKTDVINWLKNRVYPKQEWSKDDITRINEIIETLNIVQANRVRTQRMHYNKATIDKNIVWLKFLKDIVQQKVEWSEEDEKMFNRCVNTMKGAYYLDGEALYWLENRFKSPRPHNNITDEELAQAKKDAYRDALDKIEYHSGDPTFDDGWSAAIWYLKKRNTMPQSCWKPSELQIEALESATANCAYSEYEDCLRELITQLKKLREE